VAARVRPKGHAPRRAPLRCYVRPADELDHHPDDAHHSRRQRDRGDEEPERRQREDAHARKWTFDRALETEASLMGLAGLALAVCNDRRVLALPAFTASKRQSS
jgi:hypothetical protein